MFQIKQPPTIEGRQIKLRKVVVILATYNLHCAGELTHNWFSGCSVPAMQS